MCDVDSVIKLLERGWTRGKLCRIGLIPFTKNWKTDRYCVIGAMSKAWHNDPRYISDLEFLECLSPGERELINWLVNEIKKRYTVSWIKKEATDIQIIATWNDMLVSDVNEVIDLLDSYQHTPSDSKSEEGLIQPVNSR